MVIDATVDRATVDAGQPEERNGATRPHRSALAHLVSGAPRLAGTLGDDLDQDLNGARFLAGRS